MKKYATSDFKNVKKIVKKNKEIMRHGGNNLIDYIQSIIQKRIINQEIYSIM